MVNYFKQITWQFYNHVTVFTRMTDNVYDNLEFDVFYSDKQCTVYCDSLEDYEACIKALNLGEDPLTFGWENGKGFDVASLLGYSVSAEGNINPLEEEIK